MCKEFPKVVPFADAGEMFQKAASYYDLAKTFYLKAEGYLKKALQYADGDEEEFVKNYLKMVQYAIKSTEAKYYQSLYMAKACDYYAKGDDKNGTYWVGKANEKGDEDNSYLETYNMYVDRFLKHFGESNPDKISIS